MFQALMQTLASMDWPFIELSRNGLGEPLRSSLAAFWAAPEIAETAASLDLVPDDWKALIEFLLETAAGKRPCGSAGFWYEAASRSESLVQTDPLAASIVGLQSLAAWVGGMGELLAAQPFQGPHPGWYHFPLVVARSLAAADALWGARQIAEAAYGFIESSKYSHFDPHIKRILAEYRTVLAIVQRRLDACVANLAWELRAACRIEAPNFRAETAALLWALGDAAHAELMRPGGLEAYVPPASIVRSAVDQGMRVLGDDPFVQYILLTLKDRPPFSLREHRVLFGAINNVYQHNAIHFQDLMMPEPASPAFARALIGYCGGRVDEEAKRALALTVELGQVWLSGHAPVAFLRMTTLMTLVESPDQRQRNWARVARLSADVVEQAQRLGDFATLAKSLDVCCYYLPNGSREETEGTLDAIEHVRVGNLWYWLMANPPYPGEAASGADAAAWQALLEEEEALLLEFRGARFIRLLPFLPAHYRRYGFLLDDAFSRSPPEGAAESTTSLMRFDPFDQDLALREAREAANRLADLHSRMVALSPAYARDRLEPWASEAGFRDMLRKIGYAVE